MARVLLTVDEGTGSLAAVRGLRAAGYEPYVATFQAGAYAARSRAAAAVVRVPDPKSEPKAFATAIGAAARRFDVAAILPGSEGSLRALAGREASLPAVAIGTCRVELLERATDKTLLAQLARRAGLETPPTVEIDAASRDLGDVAFPAIVKPIASVVLGGDGTMRSHDVTRVRNVDELRKVLAASAEDRWLVQRYVGGELSAICGVAWHGEVVCASHQASRRIWPPGAGISSFAVTVAPDEELEAGVRRLIDAIGWSGIFGVQFLRGEGHAYLIDLNPRIYGSLALAIAAGHNLPAIWADLLLGRLPRVGPYRVGAAYRFEEDDVRAIFHAARRGNVRALAALLPRRDTTHAVFSLRDPAPLLVTLGKLKRLVART